MPVNEEPIVCPKCGQKYPAAAGIHADCPEGGEQPSEPPAGEFFTPKPVE